MCEGGRWLQKAGQMRQNVQSLETNDQHSLVIPSCLVQRRVAGHEASLVPSLCPMRYLERGSVKHIGHNPESKAAVGCQSFEVGE